VKTLEKLIETCYNQHHEQATFLYY